MKRRKGWGPQRRQAPAWRRAKKQPPPRDKLLPQEGHLVVHRVPPRPRSSTWRRPPGGVLGRTRQRYPISMHCVSADGKMSEIAELELTHQGGASSTEKPWRCERDGAKGGRRERGLRDEKGGPFGPGDCARAGYRTEHGAAVSARSGGDAAQATASAFLEAGRVRGVRRTSPGGRTGELRRAAPGAA